MVQSGAVVNLDGTVTSLGNGLNVTGGTANLGSNSLNLASLNLTGGGTLTGSGTLTVTGALTWTGGGKMAGTGQTIAEGAVSINNGKLDTRSFTSDATATLSGTLSFYHSAGFTNAATATFNAQTGASLGLADSSAPTFKNAGTFNAQPGAGDTMTDSGVAFTNTGTVNVTSGTFSLRDMTLTNSSVINQTGSSTLQVSSGATLNNASAGTYTWSASTLDVAGTFTNAGTMTVSGSGTETLTGTLTNTANFDQTGSGTLQFGSVGAGAAFTNDTRGTYTWSAGTVDVTNLATLTNAGTIDVSGSGTETLLGTLTNNSVINQTGAGTLQLGSGSRLTNNAAGTYDFQTNGSIAGGTLTSTGMLEKTKGTGTSTISSAINSTGKVIVDTGKLDLSGAVTQVSGTTLAAGTWQATGTKTVAAALDITSARGLTTIGAKATVALYGPNSTFTNLAALTTNQGSFSLLGGQSFTTAGKFTNSSKLTLGPGSVLAVSGNFTETSASALTIEMGGTTTSPTIGSTSATGKINLAGSFTLSSTVTPAIGTVLTVVNNRGTSAIGGLFAGHPKGSTITVNGTPFKISYAGGAKRRSVTLTRGK